MKLAEWEGSYKNNKTLLVYIPQFPGAAAGEVRRPGLARHIAADEILKSGLRWAGCICSSRPKPPQETKPDERQTITVKKRKSENVDSSASLCSDSWGQHLTFIHKNIDKYRRRCVVHSMLMFLTYYFYNNLSNSSKMAAVPVVQSVSPPPSLDLNKDGCCVSASCTKMKWELLKSEA